jgi:hypothetical protein
VTKQILQAITANRLTDGVPVYFTADHGWSTKIADAAYAADMGASLSRAGTETLSVVEPSLIEVEIVDGAVQPVGLRERIRAYGPTA